MSFERATARNLLEFERLAATFAAELRPGDVVALSGELGAGKTTFTAALVRALHGNESVSSPTFVFRQRYDGVPPVEHLDLYRIESPGEARELGLEEAFDPANVVVVEWPERLPSLLGPRTLRVTIAGAGDEPRELTIERP